MSTSNKAKYSPTFLLQYQKFFLDKPQDFPDFSKLIEPKPQENNNNSNRGRRGQDGRNRKGQPYQRNINSNKNQFHKHPSESLKASEGRWTRPSRNDSSSIEEITRKTQGILNKLTLETFTKLSSQLLSVGIQTPHCIDGLIVQIFCKAIQEPHFSSMYSDLCTALSQGFEKNKVYNNFTQVLLSHCKKQFDGQSQSKYFEFSLPTSKPTSSLNVNVESTSSLSDSSETPSTLEAPNSPAISRKTEEVLEEDREEFIIKQRKKALGNMKFIGELYKNRLAPLNVVSSCIVSLLNFYQNFQPNKAENINEEQEQNSEEKEKKRIQNLLLEVQLESLVQLLRTVGPIYEQENQNKKFMRDVYQQINELSTNTKNPSRIRFLFQDLLEFRSNNWIGRRKEEDPKLISEIHREAQIAEQKRDWENRNVKTLPPTEPFSRNSFSQTRHDTGSENFSRGRSEGWDSGKHSDFQKKPSHLQKFSNQKQHNQQHSSQSQPQQREVSQEEFFEVKKKNNKKKKTNINTNTNTNINVNTNVNPNLNTTANNNNKQFHSQTQNQNLSHNQNKNKFGNKQQTSFRPAQHNQHQQYQHHQHNQHHQHHQHHQHYQQQHIQTQSLSTYQPQQNQQQQPPQPQQQQIPMHPSSPSSRSPSFGSSPPLSAQTIPLSSLPLSTSPTGVLTPSLSVLLSSPTTTTSIATPPTKEERVLSTEEMENKIDIILEELNLSYDIEEALRCFQEELASTTVVPSSSSSPSLNVSSDKQGTSTVAGKLVIKRVLYAGLEKTQKRERELFAQLLKELWLEEIIPHHDYYPVFSDIISRLEDLSIDIPHCWKYISHFLSVSLVHRLLPASSFYLCLSPLLNSGGAFSVLITTLCSIKTQFNEDFLKSRWKEVGYPLSAFIPPSDNKENGISYEKYFSKYFEKEEQMEMIKFIEGLSS